jgi:hypothetical protein
MADLAMCEGVGCERREECYRHRATPDEICQSYFVDQHPCKDDYEYFIPTHEDRRAK